MSEPEPSDVASNQASPDATSPDATSPDVTSFELVRRLAGEGASHEAMLEALTAKGLSREDATVLMNAVVGKTPDALPEATFTVGTNPLAPTTFSFSDLGFSGPTHVVGLYWMAIGAAIVLALGLGAAVTEAGLAKLPPGVGFYALRLGGVAALAALTWGAVRYAQGITIRRKP